jgi:glycosyltransferase involved in cell wall biosynthesis
VRVTELAISEAVPLAHALVDRVAAECGVRVLFIKGPTAVEQGLRAPRASLDVDALIDPARRHVLAERLTTLGWVDEHPYTSPTVLPMHSTTHRHQGWPCELDLHDRFPGFFADPQVVFERLWERRRTVTVGAHDIPCPDPAGQALVIALHALRDPHDRGKMDELATLAERVAAHATETSLRDLSELARDVGAADTAAPFLDRVGAPSVGRGTTDEHDLRAWHLRTQPSTTTAVSWVNQLRALPWYRWPGYLWYAAMLSDVELRLADPNLPRGRGPLVRARVRRLQRGLRALPGAVGAVRRLQHDGDRGHPRVRTVEPDPTGRILIVQEILPEYRVPFFEGLRSRLADKGVALTVVHGYASGGRAQRRDAGELPWAVTTRNRHLALVPGMKSAVWQPVPRPLLRQADLVVVEPATRLLLNYRILAPYLLRGHPRLVLWGHGADLQAVGSRGRIAERLRGTISRRPHWWLAYTRGSADRVAANGFPRERITVVQNAVEVVQPGDDIDRRPGHCAYVGSLYPNKRIDFLLEAAAITAQLRPDFRLTVIGDGEDRELVDSAASAHDWLDFRGPGFGETTAQALRQSSLLLMPGLVGLAVVDAFAHECPMVTVDLPFHSPEVEYLENGVNGLCLPAGTTPAEYGRAVADLLGDEARLETLRAGCREAAGRYTLDVMVGNVADGLIEALRVAKS